MHAPRIFNLIRHSCRLVLALPLVMVMQGDDLHCIIHENMSLPADLSTATIVRRFEQKSDDITGIGAEAVY